MLSPVPYTLAYSRHEVALTSPYGKRQLLLHEDKTAVLCAPNLNYPVAAVEMSNEQNRDVLSWYGCLETNQRYTCWQPGNSWTGIGNCSIVVVGASAGGLASLEEFLQAFPATTDAAIVIIQHLSPDYRSFLDQLLQRHTELMVKNITDGMLVESKTVYVLPPNKEAILCQHRLLLTDRSQERSVIYPIDDFLRSLANEGCEQAIAVIFSGTEPTVHAVFGTYMLRVDS